MGLSPTGLAEVVPEGWAIKSIDELLVDRSITDHLDGNHGELYPRSHEFKRDGVPYIGANGFENGDVVFTRCKFLSEERALRFRKGVAKDGDVLFAHNATVGSVALLHTSLEYVVLSTTATFFRVNPRRLSNSYVKVALQSFFFVSQYRAMMAQSTRFQVPITPQRKLHLLIPPNRDQEFIATRLDGIDDLLRKLQQVIAKKRDLK